MQRLRHSVSLIFKLLIFKNMMRKLFVFGSITILLASCIKSTENTCPYKDITVTVPAAEATSLQNYITANHPAAIQHSSGLFYEITTAGTGTVTPTVCSTVTVKYSGYLTSGYKFDENLSGYIEILGRLVLGWQKGLPLIKSGGSISLYLPPSMGYGNQNVTNPSGAVIIPANSILIFNIQLVAVQ